jgi:probable F420-dependent oxidoreductase
MARGRQAEALGYSTLTLPDHYDDQAAVFPVLAAVAMATRHLRLGALVWNVGYRHPVVLAKEVATLDLLSGGRVELGLGAGWNEREYEQMGIPFEPPSHRIERLTEAVHILRGLAQAEPFSFHGRYYRVTELRGSPTSVQGRGMPLLIGGGGRNILTLAARHADIAGLHVNLKSGTLDAQTMGDASPAALERRLRWVQEAAGDRFDSIELSALAWVTLVTDHRAALETEIAGLYQASVRDFCVAPYVLLGTVEEIVTELQACRTRYGISYFIVQMDAMEAFAPVVARLAGH